MLNLDGTSKTIELAPGYRIAAQGLRGTVEVHEARKPGTQRGGLEMATEAFDKALEATGVNNVKTIELNVQSVPVIGRGKTIRTTQGEDGLMLEVPDLGERVGQVVLAMDEDGVITWNFPVDRGGRLETPQVRGAGGSKRFLIRRHVPPTPLPSETGKRGLMQIVGRKILKVLVYPVADAILGPISAHFVHKWEVKNRPYLIRHFGPDDYQLSNIPGLNFTDWKKLSEGRALLFIHGTTSTSHAGFATFPRPTLEELYQGYGGRVFAFNHFTLSEDTEENMTWFMSQVPAELHLELDIVCHSRGGLVARTLAGELEHFELLRLNVKRIVFVGTPNNGTALADPDHLNAFIDRYTSILNLIPPAGPLQAITETLETIIMVVKVIGHAVLNGLPGLTVMNPQSQFLQRLSTGVQMDTKYYAITSDYEPKGGLKDLVMDQLVDRVFKNEANDLLVPTVGVYKGSQAPSFPIPDAQILQYVPERGVGHSDYFTKRETSDKLKEWLLASQ